jgi:predicted TPR repeat methyltransferase
LDNNHIYARNNLAATFIHHDRFENALTHYQELLKSDPDNHEYLYNSGVAQMALGHLNEAILYFEKLLNSNPGHFDALSNLAAVHIRLEQKEKAIEYLEKALVQAPNNLATQFMLHALKGDTKYQQTSGEYIKNLFNNYALNYDKHLQETLNYSLPQQMGRLLHQQHLLSFEHTLDLGCGTGLSGIVLRDISSQLTGVDISEKMLLQAKAKGIYDNLVHSEALIFLQQHTHSFALIVALDVLPYFSELNTLFELVKKHLSPKGIFIFSIEKTDQDNYILQSTARYAHQPLYISRLCKEYQFNLIHQSDIEGRKQLGDKVAMQLYMISKDPSN